MLRTLFWLVALVAIFSSCVPNKQYVLLQKDDLNKKDLPTDTVQRTYQLQLSNYKIQPQDQLSINIVTLTPDEYNFIKELAPQAGMTTSGGAGGAGGGMGWFVDNEGSVTFPVLGKIKLSGLTIFKAEEKMKEILKDLLRDPVVRIRVINFRFTFVGEINRQITAPSPRISMMEALAMAGGLTELSNRENIKIIRQRGDQADVFYVNMLKEDFVASPNFYLQQNDICPCFIIPVLVEVAKAAVAAYVAYTVTEAAKPLIDEVVRTIEDFSRPESPLINRSAHVFFLP